MRWPRDRVHYHLGGLTGLVEVIKGIAVGKTRREKPFLANQYRR